MHELLFFFFTADLGASPGGPDGSHWVLDPIDGTKGFVGMRQYAVCLGLLQDGKVGAHVAIIVSVQAWAIDFGVKLIVLEIFHPKALSSQISDAFSHFITLQSCFVLLVPAMTLSTHLFLVKMIHVPS